MKIVSFNVNGIRSRLHQLEKVIEKHQPDVIGLSPPLGDGDHIKLEGPDPMSLEIFHGPRTGR